MKTLTNQLKKKGFALVSVISVVVLMALVAVALLSLSVLNSRSQSVSDDTQQARQNAILAMKQGLGDLQLLTGSDTRITASADIIDEGNPKVTAVWRSREASDLIKSGDEAGRPIAPNYDDIDIVGDPTSITADVDQGRYLGILTNQRLNQDGLAIDGISRVKEEGFIPLVKGRDNTTDANHDPDDDFVYVEPSIIDGDGAMAFAVFGENSKATIQSQLVDEREEELLAERGADGLIAYWQDRFSSSGRANASVAGYEAVDDPSQVFARFDIPSFKTLDLIQDNAPGRRFHDYTVSGNGLLTNVNAGGWKKDLSLFSETFEDLIANSGGDAADNPWFPALSLGSDTAPLFASHANNGDPGYASSPNLNPLLYPWFDFINKDHSVSIREWEETAAVGSWTNLVNHVTQYKDNSADGSVTFATQAAAGFNFPSDEDIEQWHLGVRRSPLIARIQFIVSVVDSAAATTADPTARKPEILVSPVVTIWNPYSTSLELDQNYALQIRQPGPTRFTFELDGTRYEPASLGEIISGNNTATSSTNFSLLLDTSNDDGDDSNGIEQRVTLEPGQAMVFGFNGSSSEANPTLVLTPGFLTEHGARFDTLFKREQKRRGRVINSFIEPRNAPEGSEFKIVAIDNYADSFGQKESALETGAEIGYWFTFWGIGQDLIIDRGGANGVNDAQLVPFRAKYAEILDLDGAPSVTKEEIIDALYPPSEDGFEEISKTLGDIDEEGEPVMKMTLGVKGVSPVPFDKDQTNQNTKGMLQANPFMVHVEIGSNNTAFGPSDDRLGTGADNPINNPVTLYVEEVSGWNDTQTIPQFNPDDNSAYLLTGDTAGHPTRVIIAEVPTRPLNSLAQLQHWEALKKKPVPPYTYNVVGNSNASPIFLPESTGNTLGSTGTDPVPFDQTPQHMSNDDSYLLNRMLFDDWIFTSIAPDMEPFSSTVARPMEEVFKDFLRGTRTVGGEEVVATLANTSYKLANHVDVPRNEADLDDLVSEILEDYSQDTTNSTGFRYENIASMIVVEGMFNVNSTSVKAWEAFLKNARNTPMPNFENGNEVVISDNAVDATPYNRTSIAAEEDAINSIAVLSDAQIEEFARQIVDIVRERGPFLSLSEFVNRQLTEDPDRALAGVIQTALKRLEENADEDLSPYTALKALAGGDTEVTSVDSFPGAQDSYRFPEAARGSALHGVPGWITQADILTPIAPVLSARDDTFTIRAYGDKRNANGEIVAKAWCEATVERTAQFVDEQDRIGARINELTSDVNKLMGRKYRIISFKWLSEDEL